jgi:hypothetical protein
LVEARCRTVCLYLENSVERIRNGVLNKHCSQAKLEQAYEIAEKYRLFVRVNVILGSPGETNSDIAENIQFLERHSLGQVKFLRLFVLPGTELHKKYPNCHFIHNPNISDQQYANLRFILGLHYSPFAIQLRRLLHFAGKSLLLVQDAPAGNHTLRAMQELALMIGLHGKPTEKLPSRMTLLVESSSGNVSASLPPNSTVVRFLDHPLATRQEDDGQMNEIRETHYDYMLLPSDRPDHETLDSMILMANQLGVPRAIVVNRRHGVVFDYDLFSKNLSQHRFCLNFSEVVGGVLEDKVPMSNQSTDFQLLEEGGAFDNVPLSEGVPGIGLFEAQCSGTPDLVQIDT